MRVSYFEILLQYIKKQKQQREHIFPKTTTFPMQCLPVMNHCTNRVAQCIKVTKPTWLMFIIT